MILITGGAGFIGSNLINSLLSKNFSEIVSVDHKNFINQSYFINKKFSRILPVELNSFLKKNKKKIKTVVHLGAITSTTERNVKLIIENNLELSIFLWNWCEKNNKRLIYASSAATYGDGSNSFDDNESDDYLSKLVPLNLYGWSKHIFDRLILRKKKKPSQLVGLKFFNVYGPNEFHKSEMKSVILKIYEKVSNNLQVKLFKSHNVKFKDGEQLRDFIYVKDVISILEWFLDNPKINGLYNVGTGKPRSFNDIAKSIFKNTNKATSLKYINTPPKIRKQYQYYTKANIKKLRDSGYKKSFFSLEEGIKDYIREYLRK
ncbi:MAG: ADP-glyceromanno-heptose 6-epimerase [Rickettsiales bacterium]|nr:ADP-glyceromanno-heptose 6-epimerase [Rickettsiales bacterium]